MPETVPMVAILATLGKWRGTVLYDVVRTTRPWFEVQ
jgi:hypothetical protein